MKPVRLPASATLALPRWGLLLLALLYILSGLIGRDPWKNDDAAGFGIMWTMAHGGVQDWLIPNIIGQPIVEEGPLVFWIGALCIKLFGWLLGDAMAARLANIGFFLLGAASLWSATYRLGKRPEAQPMQLAFGGQPEPKDYGRMLADGAVLIYLGSLGLFMHSHETKPEALLVSLVALVLFVSVRYAEQPGWRNACLLGLALGCLGLTRSWVMPLALWINLLALFWWLQDDIKKTAAHMVVTLVLAAIPIAIWLVAASQTSLFRIDPVGSWMNWNLTQVGLPNPTAILYFFKNGIWFFWPAWPFAIWAVYAWRRQRHDLHIVLALSFVTTLMAIAFINQSREETSMLVLLPALAVLASFGLPTMRRGAINAADWFSVMALTACAIFVWIGWIALRTGWPPRMVKNISKYAPGFVPEFDLIAFLVATCASIGWFLLVYWRVSRQPKVLWRAVVLSSGGLILLWLLLTTLWLPWIDYSKSYAGVAREIARRLPTPQTCVHAHVGLAQRASFAYLGPINISRPDDESCDFLVQQDRINKKGRANVTKSLPAPPGNWQLVWEGSRPGEFYEHFRLFRRQ